jgi:hypothetical protein
VGGWTKQKLPKKKAQENKKGWWEGGASAATGQSCRPSTWYQLFILPLSKPSAKMSPPRNIPKSPFIAAEMAFLGP